ncbi:MAG: 50S ribosomal protein L9 [Anaerolineae bacterium]|nr:50S ribosomal protein L9 [Anaerolineae bacterium]
MKIILLQDVYKQGVAGEVVNVAPGFARNYLIPRGMAVKATPGAMRKAENLRKQADVRRAERGKEFDVIADKIRESKLYFGVKAGETGKLYGSVTPADIADQLKEEIGLDIDRRRIGDHPLRELGEFSVPVRLEAGLAPLIRVVVYREGHDPRLEAEAEAEEAAAEVEDIAVTEAEMVEAAVEDKGSAVTEAEEVAAEDIIVAESEAKEPAAEDEKGVADETSEEPEAE